MATTPMSAFLFILYILQTIPQDLTPGYGNNYCFFKEMFFMGLVELGIHLGMPPLDSTVGAF